MEQCLQISGSILTPSVSVLHSAAVPLAVYGEACLSRAPIWVAAGLFGLQGSCEKIVTAKKTAAGGLEVDSQLGQSGQSSLGGSLARKRYQRGYLFLRGKKQQIWVGRWLEDVIGPDNRTVRIHKPRPSAQKRTSPPSGLPSGNLISVSRVSIR